MCRGPSLNPYRDEIIELWNQTHSTQAVAAHFNATEGGIRNALIRFGVQERRPRKPELPVEIGFRAPPVSRDPCGFCGVRGDIGCNHSRRWAA